MSELDKEKDLEIEETYQEQEAEQTDDIEETADIEEACDKEEADDIKQDDRYLRLMAEYDNFKKRTQKEKIEIYTSATADVIEAILPVLDATCRAVEIEPESEGLSLIKKQFNDAMKSIGVEEINAVGEQFDPELHNAVMHIDDEAIDNNTIVEEFAKGYKYKNKVIRHSMVKVAN